MLVFFPEGRKEDWPCHNIGCIVTYLGISDGQNAFEKQVLFFILCPLKIAIKARWEKPLRRIDSLEISLVIE